MTRFEEKSTQASKVKGNNIETSRIVGAHILFFALLFAHITHNYSICFSIHINSFPPFYGTSMCGWRNACV
jgi:hypothetical protein